MRIGIENTDRQEISEGLSHLLADVYATYLKTQNFHWNLAGNQFFSLHVLFEKQYEALAKECDEIAERIRALGFYVEASFAAFSRLSRVKDEDRLLTINDMLESLIEAHETVSRHARNVSRLAEKKADGGSVDMLGKLMAAHEKMAWMLRASK